MTTNTRRLIYIARERLTTPVPGIVEVVANGFWATDEDGRLALVPTSSRASMGRLGAAPLCNPNRTITERFAPDGSRIELVPFVFLPWSETLGGYLTERQHGAPVREYLEAVAA